MLYTDITLLLWSSSSITIYYSAVSPCTLTYFSQLQIDPETYPLEIRTFIAETILKKFDNLKNKYSDGVGKIIDDLENTKIKELIKTISSSDELSGLTNSAVAAIKSIESALQDFESIVSNTASFMHREYNIVRYKLDTSIFARDYEYHTKSTYVWKLWNKIF